MPTMTAASLAPAPVGGMSVETLGQLLARDAVENVAVENRASARAARVVVRTVITPP
jgi:hypothetical protein